MESHEVTITLTLTETQYQRVCALWDGMRFSAWKSPEKMLTDLILTWVTPPVNRRLRLWERKCRDMTAVRGVTKSAVKGGSHGKTTGVHTGAGVRGRQAP